MKNWNTTLKNTQKFIDYTKGFPKRYQEAFLLGYINGIVDNTKINNDQAHLLLDLKDEAVGLKK
ncbi:hypothetical protein B9T64_06550 [Bacillus halotolerans]|uniref:hypothetical protein n=1 Tax=Bacillus halotolerans TaxID=260554 RepID=UPI000BFEFDF6|nr:hypothetical protein [Bacillus halotolerans]PHI49640.1 hypothetical protein B9T64_06550 [Bacillus halotolerans]